MEKQFYQNAVEWKKKIFLPHVGFQVGKPAVGWLKKENQSTSSLKYKKVRNRCKSLVAKRSVSVTTTKRYQE